MIQPDKFKTTLLTGLAVSMGAALVLPYFSRADMSEADYRAAFQLAQKKVMRQKSLNSQSAIARSTSLIRNLFGRAYRIGDQWDIAAWSFDNTMARMTTDPAHLQTEGGRGGIFRYEVIDVKTGDAPGVLLQITQLEDYGMRKADARVYNLKLFVTDRMIQSQKTYAIADRAGRTRSISVAAEGIHSAITPLELFPLDVPELNTAESSKPDSIPTLPAGLRDVARLTGYHPDLAQCVAYEQDDFFGRGLQILWQIGDPWPAYIKSSNGVSILIRKGAL